jgi:hypothetical protein
MAKRFLLLCLCATMVIALFGCAKKQVQTEPAPSEEPTMEETMEEEPAPEPETVEPAVEEVEPTPMEKYEMQYSELPLSHEVVKGECLWWIAEYEEIYNDPFMWPLIYKANRDQINDPDLIYPGQVFYIPRTFSLDKLKDSRQSAGAPAPHLPPKDANLPANLRSELGWGF